jgi:hypothetical protein
MMLALVLAAQVATAPPPPNPCADQLAELCRISAYFCPGAYPPDLVPGSNGIPCWPDRGPVSMGAASAGAAASRGTANLGRRDIGDGTVAPHPRSATASLRDRLAAAVRQWRAPVR